MLKITFMVIVISLLTVFFALVIFMAFVSFSNVTSTSLDDDFDNVVNDFDNCPTIKNIDQTDFDNDSIGNICDLDDDNDQVSDSLDFFDADPTEWADFDFDGIGSNQDTDDDNDGIIDSQDPTSIPVVEGFATEYLDDLEICLDSNKETKQLLCLNSFFHNVIQNGTDAKIALELAASLPKSGAVNDCHFISHNIGKTAFEVTQDLSLTFELGERWCRSGYYHGVMVSYFHYLKENDSDIDNFENACDSLKGTTNYQNCIHGLGHGLAHYFGDDLIQATSSCNVLSYYPDTICLGGVMMQYTDKALLVSDNFDNTIKSVCDNSDLDSLESKYCYIGLGISIAAHTENDLDKSLDYCSILSEDESKNCQFGARREIIEAQQSDVAGLPDSKKDLLQSFTIKNDKRWIVDFSSSSIISNFEYDATSFKFQTSDNSPIMIYMSRTILPNNGIFSVNGEIQTDVEIQTGLVGNYVLIKLTPEESGLVSFKPEFIP